MALVAAQKIGLEIHIYPRTECKMFCTCSSDFLHAEANTNICPVCTGQPGSKPMPPNMACVEAGLQIAATLSMDISAGPVSTLRKHYFYPDLPSNYQRTAEPLATGGKLQGFELREIHWEEDPGQYDMVKGVVDLNRSGVPLLELVTEPVLKNPSDAKAVLNDTLLLLQYLEIVREEAPFKVDTNISLEGGERVEVKNINSISGVVRALEFEFERQSDLLERGLPVEQETRHFDEIMMKTYPMRFKETAEDYRYMRDPDIIPLNVGEIAVRDLGNPFTILESMCASGAREEDARAIVSNRDLVFAYNRVASGSNPLFASHFVARDLRGELNFRKMPPSFIAGEGRMTQIAAIAAAWSSGRLSNQSSTSLLRSVFEGRDVSAELRTTEGVFADEASLDRIAAEIISSNPDVAERYRRGSTDVINYLVGLCMKKLEGRARAQDVIAALRRRLG